MAGVEDRVVSMSFDNAKFKAAVAETLAALTKLNESLKIDPTKFNTGTSQSINALDRLKAALKFDSSKFKSDTDQTTGALGKLKSALHIDGSKFQTDTEKSTSALGRLKNALHLPGAAKGLDDIQKSGSRLNLGPVGSAADAIGSKFTAMQAIALGALASIGAKAAAIGGQVVKDLTIGPIASGLTEYETNLNSIQTVLANTAAAGTTLKDVNAALLELNQYSDKTIYNFSQMAKNIGTFTAAGVDLETATGSIKGIANLAAVSGSTSEQAATAMTQLSQAISSGRVSLQDWNSVVNAGMGGTVFQRALATTAERMGTLSKGSVELKGKMKNVSIEGESFRESITAKPGEESWLTSEVLTNTLQQFTGDLSDAELAAQGFSKAQIEAIQDQAKMAVKAATEVKTLSGVIDTAKESAGSGWSQTWQIIFGDFGEAKELFTGVSLAINGFIGASADARNKVLGDWKELGGRTALIDGIKNAFEALKAIVTPIKEAFRQIFPAKTGQDLFDLTVKFRDFMAQLKIGPETAENLRRTFAGVFSIFSIGKQIIGGLFEVIKILFGAVTSGSGSVLNFTGNVGDLLVALDSWLKEGDRLKNFFKTLGTALAAPIALLGELKDVIVGLFDGVDTKDAENLTNSLGRVGEKLAPLKGVLDGLKSAWDAFVDVISGVAARIGPAIDEIVNLFGDIGTKIASALTANGFDGVFQIIQTGLVAGIFLAIKKALGGGLNIDFGGGAIDGLRKAFDALTGSLKTMQQNVQANTLLQIAAAMAVLAVAVVALSRVNSEDLAKSMTAIAVGFGQLTAVMAVLGKNAGGFAKMPFIAGSLILLAGAMVVLAAAVKILSTMSWEELVKGLAGVGALLVGLSLAIGPLSSGSAKLVVVGAGLILLAIALNILAGAVKIFATMSWSEMAKGLAGVAGALIAITAGVALIPPSILLIGPGLIAVGIALGIIAGAVMAFGSMNWGTLGKGLAGIAGSLLIIAGAILLMPPHMPIMAAGLILVGIALTSIAAAVALMGNLSLGTLAKGIGAIAAILIVLAAGLTAMIAALPGAAALLVAAAALAVLAPVIGILGTMSWGTIAKGLVAIGAAMIVIATTGLIAAPALLLLGAAMVGLGVGILLVGTGVKVLADGLSKLASDGAKGVAVLIAAITGLLLIIPKIAIDFVKGLLAIAKSIVELAPEIVSAIADLMIIILDAVIKAAPKMGQAMTAVMQAALQVIRDNIPTMITTGFEVLTAFLTGLRDNIGDVTRMVGDIVVRFLQTLTGKLPAITKAGLEALTALLQGIADNLGKVINAAGNIVASLIKGVVAQHSKIIAAGVDAIIKFIRGITDKALDVVNAGGDLIIRVIRGVTQKGAEIAAAGREAIVKFINAVASEALKLGREGADAVINFINGVANAIREKSPQLNAAGANLASAIIQGVVSGIAAGASGVVSALVNVAGNAIDAVKRKLKIKSPSRVFHEIGVNLMKGWANGMDNNSAPVVSVENMVETILASLSKVPDIIELDPTIKPVLDLSNVERDAQRLNGMLNVIPITAAASYGQAAAISAAQQTAAQEAAVTATGSVTEFKFEQNNYSPDPLSDVEIYRQTRNQLALAKSALGIAT